MTKRQNKESMRRIHEQSCPGKVAYPDSESAHYVLDEIKRQRGAAKNKRMNVYRCMACGRHHLGNDNRPTNRR